MKNIQEYILKDKEIYVGLEDSKRSWKLCVRNGRTVVNEVSMPAEYNVLKKYFDNKFPGCKIRVMYEAGFRGFTLQEKLVSDGWECIVTPPHTVSQEKCSSIKNDRIDCRRLAKNNENNDYKECFVHPKNLRENRQICRLYDQVQSDIVRVSNRIRRTLEYHGIDILYNLKRWSPVNYKEAQEKIAKSKLSESLRFTFEIMFEELNGLRLKKKNILKKINEISNHDNYKRTVELLKTVPGIGNLSSIKLALELGDLKRFNRKESISKFLGLIPRDYSTGESIRKGHITKQGNRSVRCILVESAWVSIRHDPILLKKYQNIVSRCGSGKKAIVAVARKLAIRIRRIILNDEPYQVGLISN